MSTLTSSVHLSPAERAERRARAEAYRARMEECRRAALEAEVREMFAPSWPPEWWMLKLGCYPPRAPGGALIVRSEMVGDAWVMGGLRIARVVAADGRSWLEIQEAPLRQCGAQVVDATSPMWSPFLERDNSSFTIPSEEWIARFGERTWLVMHEGAKESSGE